MNSFAGVGAVGYPTGTHGSVPMTQASGYRFPHTDLDPEAVAVLLPVPSR
jgi:hypothetical protein